jgi:predicted nucleotidyltransferase
MRDFIARVTLKYTDNYRSGFLYGSHARGTAKSGSDIDILVLMDRVDHWSKRAIFDIAYDEFLETGVDISPLVMSVAEYERQKMIGIPLITEIERDRVLL